MHPWILWDISTTNQPTPPLHTLRPSVSQDLMLTLDPEGSPTVGGPVLLGRDGRGLTRAFTRTKTLEGRYTLGGALKVQVDY